MGANSGKPIIDPEEQSSSTVIYKTSIYGWGRLKHPVKQKRSQQNVSKKKSFDSNANQGKPISHEKSRLSKSEEKNDPKSSSLLTKPSPLKPGNETQKLHTPSTSKLPFGSNKEKQLVDRKILPEIKDNVTKPKSTRPSFYGQYRCNKCSKYWRSPHSQEGVPQNCTKCGTPTLPRK